MTSGDISMSLETLFCYIDDFCQYFLPQWEREQLACGERKWRRPASLPELRAE
jgi:hypothetical protein